MAERQGEPAGAGAGIEAERLAELVAGVSVVHEKALARLEFPALLLDLPGGRIRACNQPAADLFDLPPAALIGQINTDAAIFDDPEAVRAALATLDRHGIDGYRAHRTVTTRSGLRREVSVWCRAIDLDGVRYAAYIIRPTGEGRGRPGSAPLPILALEPMVVGTADPEGRVERVSSDVFELSGWSPSEVVGRSAFADLHPDDLGRVVGLLAALRGSDMVTSHARLRHHDGSWIDVRILLLPLGRDRDRRFAFAMLPDTARPPLERAADAVADLEARIRRLALEMRATLTIDEVDRLPSVGDHPEIAELSSRQWEILSRLLRGDRVTTIADELDLSPNTVRNHLSVIFRRFGVHSQAELLARLRPRS